VGARRFKASSELAFRQQDALDRRALMSSSGRIRLPSTTKKRHEMVSAKIQSVLNQLVALHNRSLVSYLSYASPTWHPGDDKAKSALSLITEQQSEIVDRIGEVIVRNGGAVDYGAYPMTFTGLHDLSFAYLLDQLIDRQNETVDAIERCVVELPSDPRAYELAQEALGMAKGHLDSLRELKQIA
jgi:hypothetical protein